MKVLHMVADIDPRSGGPTRSVQGLCRALAQAGADTTLFAHAPDHIMENAGGVRFIVGRGSGWRVIRKDAETILAETKPDLVHIHGLWMLTSHVDCAQARRVGIPVVISTRGMLDPWAIRQKTWKKKLALAFYQRRNLKRAVAIHTTAEMEMLHVRAQGYSQPCVVLPNGVEVPDELPSRMLRDQHGVMTALFLSRLHPGKGLLTLAEAWARVAPSRGWRMRVVGPDVGGHKADVLARLHALGCREQWEFVEMLDDTEKWQAYRSAALFVHPSISENFGISIAEALYAEVPAITTKGAPWREIETNRCGWWIETGVDALAASLAEAMQLQDHERAAMGARGRKLVEERFVWPGIGREMLRAYEWLLGGSPRPACVRVD